jgi:hypothetical protein
MLSQLFQLRGSKHDRMLTRRGGDATRSDHHRRGFQLDAPQFAVTLSA